MATLEPRFHSFSSTYETPQNGWNYCMTKAYCKWPTIIGIVIGIVIFFLALYCCFRCCCCRGRRSGGGGGRKRANTTSMFNPAPYQGYQPANNPQFAPPPCNEPPRFAQFDTPSARKINEDSLPAMPSWENARTAKVEQLGEDVEMGRLGPQDEKAMGNNTQNASSVNLLPPNQGYAEADSQPLSPHYTGPDFGHGAGHPYTGPDFGVRRDQNTAYTGYSPSESTRYEPSGVNEPQELGTTYNDTMPPPNPSAQQQSLQGHQHAPSVLQAGRRPGGNGKTWKDI